MSFRKNSHFNIPGIALAFVFFAMFIASVTLFGWIFHIEVLTTFNTGWPTIKVNTALGIELGGGSLLLFVRRKNKSAILLAMIVFLLGIISLCEYIFHWDAHIDQLLFTDTWTPADKYPGRMATFTTFAISFSGISLLTYSLYGKWWKRISEFSAIFLFLLSFTGFIGALFNAGHLFREANIASFSVPTAVAGLFMSLGILFSKQETGFIAVFYKKTAAARAGLKGIFIIIVMLVFIGWLCLKGYKAGVFDTEMGIVVMIATFTISFLVVVWLGIQRINLAEDRLKASEKNLKQVLSSTGDIFYVIDKNYNITLINDIGEQNLTRAWSKPVTLGSNILELIPRDKDEPIKQSFEKVFAGERIEYELNHTRSDLPPWVSISYVPVKNDEGDVIGAYVVTKDISERKKAEEELKQSNNRFEMITRTTNDAIWEWDLESGKLWSNQTHQQLYGLTLSDPVPSEQMWIERIHPDDRERMIKRQAEALSSVQNVFISEYQFKVEKNGYRNIYDRCYIVRNPNGKPVRMVGSMMDITDRKEIEEALRKSEQRYRSLIEQASDYIMITDTQGNFIDINSSLCKTFGYTREDLLGRNVTEVIDPDQLKKDPVRFDLLTAGQTILRERRMISKDRSIIEVEVNVKLLPDGRILAIARDIRERKKAEQTILANEERYRTLVENAPEALVVFDMELGKFIDMNENAMNLFKMTKEELLNKGPVDVSPPFQSDGRPSAEVAISKLNEAIAGGKPFFEWIHSDKDGNLIPCEIRLVRLPSESHVLIRGSILDISERKKTEQAIRAVEETRRLIMDSSLDAIVCIDTRGTVTIWTPQAEKIFGWKENEIIGKTLAETIIPHRYREMHTKGIEHYLQTGEGPVLNKLIEITALDREGKEFPVELSIIPVEQGEIKFFCAFIRDITERIRAQEQIKKEKELSDSIINSLPGLFYLFDYSGKYLRWNKFKEVLTGYSAEEIAKMTPLDFFEGEEKDLVKKHIEEGFKTGETMIEANIVSKTGQKYPFYFTGIALDYEGKHCLLGTGIDISDRKRAEEQIKQSYEQIRQLTKHLQNIREEERAHIAREIHDELGQQLTVLKMDASWLSKKLNSADITITQKLKGLLELLDRTVKTVRRISSELRPSLLDDMGLVAAMDWHLKEFGKRSGIKTIFIEPGKELTLADAIKTGLFRIFQESLTNVVRHAEAKNVNISLQQKKKQIILSIKDDGKGFEKEKAFNKKTLGILGMKERSAMMGGSYEISSMPGEGTSVIVSVPYEHGE